MHFQNSKFVSIMFSVLVKSTVKALRLVYS